MHFRTGCTVQQIAKGACILLLLLLGYRTTYESSSVVERDKTNIPSKIFRKKIVLIAVPSVISDPRARDAIRSSWGNFSSWPSCEVELKLLFYIAKPRTNEERVQFLTERLQHGDIVQLQIDKEGYYSLTNKIKRIFYNAISSGVAFDYIIKTDEDTFINIPLICANFARMPSSEEYGGNCHMRTEPYRKRSKVQNPKFVLTKDEYKWKYFPPHCEGAFYYLSKPLLKKAVANFPKVKFLKLEDVYMGLVLRVTGARFQNLEKFNYRYHYALTYQKVEGFEVGYSMDLLKFVWAMHPVVSAERLIEMHEASVRLHKNGLKENTLSIQAKWTIRRPPTIKYKANNS